MTDFVDEHALWTVYRRGRDAKAAIRANSFGREMRVSIDGLVVFKRWLRDDENEDRASSDMLRTFLSEGWTRS